MRQTELHLTDADRALVDEIRSKGLHQAREVNRAHVLSSLDRGVPVRQGRRRQDMSPIDLSRLMQPTVQ